MIEYGHVYQSQLGYFIVRQVGKNGQNGIIVEIKDVLLGTGVEV